VAALKVNWQARPMTCSYRAPVIHAKKYTVRINVVSAVGTSIAACKSKIGFVDPLSNAADIRTIDMLRLLREADHICRAQTWFVVDSTLFLVHVEQVVRLDGGSAIVMTFGGFLGIGAHNIAAPRDAVVLAGTALEVLDFTPPQLEYFPIYSGSGSVLGSDAAKDEDRVLQERQPRSQRCGATVRFSGL
jgi:hypothetical protein